MSSSLCPSNVTEHSGYANNYHSKGPHHWVRIGVERAYVSKDTADLVHYVSTFTETHYTPGRLDKIIYQCVYCLTEKVGATG